MADSKKKAAGNDSASRGTQKERQGVVVSDKMDKTVVVAITRQVKHSAYGKYLRKTTKYQAHDEAEKCSIGDTVTIVETKPISKNKRWKVKEIVSKAV